MSYKLEYIWLDGYTPEPSLRSKTKIVDSEPGSPSDCPEWAFDGSSTEQAEGHSSDCLLKPVRMVPDPDRRDASLVLCEVLNPDGSPHASNIRGTFEDDEDFWFGFEQEYFLWCTKNNYSFTKQLEKNPFNLSKNMVLLYEEVIF